MDLIYVQFSDASQETIAAGFSAKQDAAVYPNQGTVAPNDPRWKAFFESCPDYVKPFIPPPEDN